MYICVICLCVLYQQIGGNSAEKRMYKFAKRRVSQAQFGQLHVHLLEHQCQTSAVLCLVGISSAMLCCSCSHVDVKLSNAIAVRVWPHAISSRCAIDTECRYARMLAKVCT
jgi:hypothetical protein